MLILPIKKSKQLQVILLDTVYVSTTTPKSANIVGRYRRKTCSLLDSYKERKKKQITEILEKYSYYDKPRVIRKSDMLDGGQTTDKLTNKQNFQSVANDPLTILKIRYAKGEITKKECKDMKKDLE